MGNFWENTASKLPFWAEKAIENKKQWTTDELAKFYHSNSWRKARKIYICNEPYCEMCKSVNLLVKATVVDHIIPIRMGGDRLAESNLQSLCTKCHNSKSRRERS